MERFKQAGFTLIELIAVISIIGIMLFFAAPRVGVLSDAGDEKTVSRWINVQVHALKERALSEQKQYTLRVGLDANSLTVISGLLTEEDHEEIEARKQKEYILPPGVRLMDVQYPGKGVVTSGKTDIRFYPKGYSDKAVIHIQDDDQVIRSFLIEPFLPSVKTYDTYLSFF